MIESLIDQLINTLFTNFDFGYMISVNVFTYLIIKLLDKYNGLKKVKTILKRVVLVCGIIIIGGIYSLFGYENKLVLLNSAILAPVFWSWVISPCMKRFNLGYYLDINETLGYNLIDSKTPTRKHNRKF